MTPRCRIAPSPTGPLHIGTARTALFNFLFARQHSGTFILRLEDTDQARSTLGYERDILDGLHWLGLEWDEGPEVAGQPARGPYGPYRQSERTALYTAAIDRLLAQDLAYPCFCTAEELAADRQAQQKAKLDPTYVGRCAALTEGEREVRRAEGRAAVIRFRVGSERVEFDDLVRGHVVIDTSALGGDLVIARSDGSPLYHFVVVVDDIEMRISHVIRGEDHLSNTPKHVLLFRALGAEPPVFAHLPLILNPDRSKMSKRKSQTAIDAYRRQGYVREAIVNHLALLGWSSGSDEEVFSMDDLVARFDLGRVQPSGAIFDLARLDWLNGQWIRRLPPDALIERSLPFLVDALAAEAALGKTTRAPTADDLAPLLPMVTERLPRLDAIGPMLDFVFVEDLTVDPALLVPKRWDAATTAAGLEAALGVIESAGAVSFEADELEPPLRALCDERGWKVGDLFMAVRVAVTGRAATPPLFDTLVAIGYERTCTRLRTAMMALVAGDHDATGVPA
jgi:nondiscriminating glutamyl-tRNA synthetase